MKTFAKGRRVIYSEHGLNRLFPRFPDRVGVIMGESRDGACWWIVWEGLISVQHLHKSFVDILEPEAEQYYARAKNIS